MAEHDVGALLVISGGRLVGILSERGLCAPRVLLGHPAEGTQVREIMTSHVVSVNPQQTVDECMTMMTEQHFRHLPVLEDDAVVGLVSIGDLVKWVISGQAADHSGAGGLHCGSLPRIASWGMFRNWKLSVGR